jgi:hypothetical protein
LSGYFDSPWPGEDGGPQRLQQVQGGLTLAPGEALRATTRSTLMSTMTVLGGPGEVFLLTHDALRSNIGLPTYSKVERIDPVTLKTTAESPRLPGGPMWPGGMAVHANGDLYVVYGRWAHRLDRDCRVKASLKLPVNGAYNSFVVLDCGLIVAKNLSDKLAARLSVIDPETLIEVGSAVCPEASIARLSAVGDTVYVVGVTTIMRFDWGSAGLQQDRDWQWNYLAGSGNSYGWDVVLAGGQAWFMDNGRHRYRTTMVGAGVSRTPNRLLRVALGDSNDHQAVEISGIPGGSITNPPLFDTQRGLVIGYDSANRHLAAWRWDGKTLVPAWQKTGFACASHMLLYADSGELVTNDHGAGGEWVVVLDIETGAETARARVGGLTQGVVFPSPGWGRDLYWCSMSRVARVFVD